MCGADPYHLKIYRNSNGNCGKPIEHCTTEFIAENMQLTNEKPAQKPDNGLSLSASEID